MDANEKDLLARLDAMSLAESRLAVARGDFGQPPDSPNYIFSSGVVAAREAAERDAREKSTERWARHAAYAAYAAATIAAISIIVLSK